jgi:hypothetical protein
MNDDALAATDPRGLFLKNPEMPVSQASAPTRGRQSRWITGIKLAVPILTFIAYSPVALWTVGWSGVIIADCLGAAECQRGQLELNVYPLAAVLALGGAFAAALTCATRFWWWIAACVMAAGVTTGLVMLATG